MHKEQKAILIVEDDISIQNLYKYYLTPTYQLLIADSVVAAKKILSTHVIEIVLLDLSLAGSEDGLVLAKLLREDENKKNLPIVVVTAHVFPRDRKGAMESGCQEFITKPIDFDLLLQVIDNLTN